MSTLYVANTTKQFHDFVYRVPGSSERVRVQKIPPGEQVRIHEKDAPPQEIDGIIKQHSRYGMLPVAEIDRRRPYIGLAYSIDKPINVEKLLVGLSVNEDAAVARAKQARAEAAAATSVAIQEDDGPKLESMGIEVIREGKDIEPFAEGVEVNREAGKPRDRRRRSLDS